MTASSSPPSATSPARNIGRYILYGELAVGGMATVHFGRLTGHAGFARACAIKRMHPHYAKDPAFVEMFLDEARVAARIIHPNVVPTLDVVSVDGELFLIMDYVRGASLSQLIRGAKAHGGVPPGIASAIMSGVLHGLHAAHEAKDENGTRLDIVHRDVSPQNILVGTDGVARVLDFGVAKAVGRSQTTQEGQLKGKLAYMAPEQVKGDPVTRRTDVYSASVVLWEALTSRRLFKSENEANVLAKVLAGNAPPPSSLVPSLPPGIDALVLRGLDLDPANRFATARDMAKELSACIHGAEPDEVSEWVEKVAAEELRARATRIADIERDAVSSPSHARPIAPLLGPPDSPTPVGQREAEPQTMAATRVMPGGEPSSQVSSVVLAEQPVKLGRVGVWVLVALAALVGVVALLVLWRATRGGATEATEAFSAEATATPTATATATPTATATATATATSTPTATSQTHATSHPKPDCNPPYTTDSRGHVHFKPACL